MSVKPLFELKPVDRAFYRERLRDFLPDRIVDIHTHVWLKRFRTRQVDPAMRAVTWPGRVAKDNSMADLVETYRLMFPGKTVTPLVFSNVLSRRDKIHTANRYTAAGARKHGFPALIFALPEWSAGEFERRIKAGGFIGAKVYLSFAPSHVKESDIEIFDYIPHHQLKVLNRNGWILMLHIPRPGRLKDPVNLGHLMEIEKRYPRVKVIVAHVGRAYCPEDVGNAFDVLRKTRRLCFDISANTNADVFYQLIRAVGPRRILFGSDLPIARMRMRRICENGRYVNLVPKGLYGDVSGDRNMREVGAREAARLTFFMYEEIDAFRRAALKAKLKKADIEDIFCNNAERLIASVSTKG